jgi:hypothetical protein
MASNTDIAEIDFGAFPGANEASVNVTGQTGITAASKVEAWVMGDDTTLNHTASDHRYFALFAALTCGTPDTSGFTIYARSAMKLQGIFKVRWVWVN